MDHIQQVVKDFEELSARELYEILKLRARVFVVEQECAYQDLDDVDYNSIHIMLQNEGNIVAYARVNEAENGLWHMGRVLTIRRGRGLGNQVVNLAVSVAGERGARVIEIEAQCYATGFYKKTGFEECSREFMLDGIPHVRMKLEL